MIKKDLIKINEYLWEIPKKFRNDMKVPARVYTSEKMLEYIRHRTSTKKDREFYETYMGLPYPFAEERIHPNDNEDTNNKLNTLMGKVDEVTRRIDNIFGKLVLIDGKWIDPYKRVD